MEVFIVLVVVVLFIALAIFSIVQSHKRRKAIEQWCAENGFHFDRGKDHSFDERFAHFDCLRQGSNRYAHNIISGQWGERGFLGFDYHYETYSTDKDGNRQTHHHYFSAVILDCALPLKPLFIRPEGFFDKITEFFGLDDIDFESAEFSRRFYVKSPDRKWAYDVLHQRAMQFLLDRPVFTLAFDGPHAIAYRGGTFAVADFEHAANVIAGLIDQLPQYVRRELTDRAAV